MERKEKKIKWRTRQYNMVQSFGVRPEDEIYWLENKNLCKVTFQKVQSDKLIPKQ